jgi:hypothetical protein
MAGRSPGDLAAVLRHSKIETQAHYVMKQETSVRESISTLFDSPSAHDSACGLCEFGRNRPRLAEKSAFRRFNLKGFSTELAFYR